MPLLKIIKYNHIQLAFWTLTESYQDLESLIILPESDRLAMEKFTSHFRKREFLTVRILLTELLGFYPEIGHDDHHRPFLFNSRLNLSISHSRSLVAVILSDNPSGIDTEETNRDITSITHRFMNEEEIHWSMMHPDPNRARILCWSIKESVFKLMRTDNVDFKSMIHISPVSPSSSGTTVVTFRQPDASERIMVNYLFENDNVITWCVFP